MKRSVEFDLRTISEANAREHWHMRKERRGDQRNEVRSVIGKFFVRPPLWHVLDTKGFTVPNRMVVTLTRLAPGSLDDDNLTSAFKATRDEIAKWLCVDDRDPRITWRYAQERTAAGVYRVRIEVQDATIGPDSIHVLAGEAEHLSGALQRVRPKAKPQLALPPKPSFAVLPWEQPETGRRLAPLARFALNENPPLAIVITDPAGQQLRFFRRAAELKKLGPVWLYETERIEKNHG